MNPTGPDQFKDLVDSVRHVLSTLGPNPSSDTTVTSQSTFSPPIYIASPVVNSASYSGLTEDCNGFLLQCLVALEMQPHQFPMERAKTSFILSLLF